MINHYNHTDVPQTYIIPICILIQYISGPYRKLLHLLAPVDNAYLSLDYEYFITELSDGTYAYKWQGSPFITYCKHISIRNMINHYNHYTYTHLLNTNIHNITQLDVTDFTSTWLTMRILSLNFLMANMLTSDRDHPLSLIVNTFP